MHVPACEGLSVTEKQWKQKNLTSLTTHKGFAWMAQLGELQIILIFVFKWFYMKENLKPTNPYNTKMYINQSSVLWCKMVVIIGLMNQFGKLLTDQKPIDEGTVAIIIARICSGTVLHVTWLQQILTQYLSQLFLQIKQRAVGTFLLIFCWYIFLYVF